MDERTSEGDGGLFLGFNGYHLSLSLMCFSRCLLFRVFRSFFLPRSVAKLEDLGPVVWSTNPQVHQVPEPRIRTGPFWDVWVLFRFPNAVTGGRD